MTALSSHESRSHWSGAFIAGCENEPIQFVGAIQSHGYLVGFDARSRELRAFSENLSSFEFHLGCSWPQWGEKLFGEHEAEKLGAMIESIASLEIGNRSRYCQLDFEGRYVSISIVRASEDLLLLEVEPSEDSIDGIDTWSDLSRVLAELHAGSEFGGGQFLTRMAAALRNVTGFDRVMVYKFHPDGHGEVVAEARDPELDSFLGLHYPASDIPQKARELYLKNSVRSVADILAPTVVVRNAPFSDQGSENRVVSLDASMDAIDLSYSHLRSLSPIHLQYLSNMGVRASFSVSIPVQGRLWGLIACHHSSPYLIRPSTREVGGVFSKLIAAEVSNYEARLSAEVLRLKDSRIAHLMEKVLQESDLLSLASELPLLMDLVEADGVAIVTSAQGGVQIVSDGIVPDNECCFSLLAALKDEVGDGLYFTDRLPDNLKHIGIPEAVRGIGLLLLGAEGAEAILWFRQEFVKVVKWAGNPSKSVRENSDKSLRPRASFDLWKETVSGTSLPWSDAAQEAARDLRRSLVSIWLDKVKRAYSETARTKKEIEEFMMAVSHDLRSPLISMMNTAKKLGLDTSLSEKCQDDIRAMSFFGNKMNQLVSDLVRFSRLGQVALQTEPVDCNQLIKEVIRYVTPRFGKADLKLVVQPSMLPVLADPRRLEQIFANLIGNAIKHGMEVANLDVTITQRELGSDMLECAVQDSGRGIPQWFLPRVFDVFEQLDRSKGGSGVGLSVVKRLVDLHGGKITVESCTEEECLADASLSRGTVFRFSLPRA